MITSSTKDSIYIGREAGKEIHERIKNAKKSVKIVLPYLSVDYLKDLISLHKKGREVTLITCDKISNSQYSDFKTSDLITKEKIYKGGAAKLKKLLSKLFVPLFALALIVAVLDLLIFNSGYLLWLALILIIAGTIAIISSILIVNYSFKYTSPFRIKVFDSASGKNQKSIELIHSKIFVIDEEIVFLGSVNFTYSGFKTHYETAIKIEDARAVRDISQEVEALFNSKELKAKSVEEWAVYN